MWEYETIGVIIDGLIKRIMMPESSIQARILASAVEKKIIVTLEAES